MILMLPYNMSYLTVNEFRFFSFLKIQLMGFAPRLALETFFISVKSILTPTWEFKRVILRQIAPNVAHCNSLHDYGHFILLVTFISRSWWCRRRASTASLASSPRKKNYLYSFLISRYKSFPHFYFFSLYFQNRIILVKAVFI